jgi:hypothetical protein
MRARCLRGSRSAWLRTVSSRRRAMRSVYLFSDRGATDLPAARSFANRAPWSFRGGSPCCLIRGPAVPIRCPKAVATDRKRGEGKGVAGLLIPKLIRAHTRKTACRQAVGV